MAGLSFPHGGGVNAERNFDGDLVCYLLPPHVWGIASKIRSAWLVRVLLPPRVWGTPLIGLTIWTGLTCYPHACGVGPSRSGVPWDPVAGL